MTVYGLRDLHTFDIVTMNVAKAPNQQQRSIRQDRARARRDYDPYARLRCGARNKAAFSRSRPTGVRVAGGDDRADQGWHLGGSHGSSGLDTGADSTHDRDVGNRSDANSLFEEAAGEGAAAELLRGERFGAAARAYSASVRVF